VDLVEDDGLQVDQRLAASSMFRRISVVITTQGASRRITRSPVTRPTFSSPWRRQ